MARIKTELHHFQFRYVSAGHYIVSYISPTTYKIWSALITDMPLIDATKNCEKPKRKDLDHLKWICKNRGNL